MRASLIFSSFRKFNILIEKFNKNTYSFRNLETKAKSHSSEILVPRQICRTSESNPVNHSHEDDGLFYTIPEDHVSSVITNCVNKDFRKQSDCFNEMCVMVRKPALEVFGLLKKFNLNNLVHKIVVYGRNGTGKSMTLAHVLHYGTCDGWLLVSVPWPGRWKLYSPETLQSTYATHRYDLPLYAMEWLAHFKVQNGNILTKYKTHHKYTWSKRDIVEVGSSLIDVIDLGLNRSKFSTDCVGVILKEIKIHAHEEGMKTLAVIDGINAFWQPSKLLNDKKELIEPENISLIHHFKKLLNPDWTNAVVIASVDVHANILTQRDKYTPRYLLGEEGNAALEPYIPILVDDYTDKEFNSSMQYYYDRQWFQHPLGCTEEAFQEIMFLSGKNPYLLMQTAGPR